MKTKQPKKKKPSVRLVLAVKKAENARVAQNTAAREFRHRIKRVEELTRKERIDDAEIKCLIDGKMLPVEFGFEASDATTITLSVAKLRRLVSEEVFLKCVVAQVGLIKQHAGSRILDKVKTETPVGTSSFYCRVKK